MLAASDVFATLPSRTSALLRHAKDVDTQEKDDRYTHVLQKNPESRTRRNLGLETSHRPISRASIHDGNGCELFNGSCFEYNQLSKSCASIGNR